ncbi:uncharacterized protein LOC129573607 [Sitodiplosis mosellana]|uniref:uncharacterized protein LOC129573607 n=1 Tax=Sitodiplosis mosellana TaxID=263140 RepID=UPI002443EAAD|nr:uncharacterized protein LOC129573607 [Sitodiplosis mosellana]
MHQKFRKYFRKLLKFFNLYNDCENEHAAEHKVLENENINSVSNEAEQMTARTRTNQANGDNDVDDDDDASLAEQIMRVSDASGSYEDVVLRPKTEQHNNRRLARPLAVLSGLFKSHRESGANQEENASENLTKSLIPPVVDSKINQKKPKRISWNIFKSKKKHRDESPSFQHFQEPLNVERVSLPIGPSHIDNDAEWYDLNREEMSVFEAQVSDIVNEFNNGNQMIGDSESESIYHCDLGRYLTISTNILWSHNLSMSCQSNGNASNINLLGANINRDQIHSDIFIEDERTSEIEDVCTFDVRRNSIDSVDSDGYAIMQPILPFKKEQPILIDDIMTARYDSDVSSNLSSGFGSDHSDSDDGGSKSSPQNPCSSITFAASPATSDFSEAFPSPATSTSTGMATTPLTAKTMQKTSKKRRFRSRNLLAMLYAKHTPLLSNVTQTPPNKLSPECMKKVHKRTSFKVRLSKKDERSVREKSSQPSLQI